eukprot:TRINITY_DN2410_c0_g1_i5.p1 TRINITY_DN2410_c0_g1~~TRINITY_DN2410_c0_g1_i5.p1  ORF type:complete len:598 (-),score=159.99 TRINITY_DN2410_c0_g1_i5:360-2153(-)
MVIFLNGEGGSVEVVAVHLNEISAFLIPVLVLVFIMFASKVVVTWLHLDKLLPESGWIIIAGCIVAFILWLINPDLVEHEALAFNPEIFFLILIPPIIFYAGISMDMVNFSENIGLILTLALVGTFINSILVGLGLFILNPIYIHEQSHLGWAEALAFGSLISAVDPVAVIAIFEEVKVNETLSVLVFGESLLNDAVSIVLYDTFISLTHIETITWVIPGLAISKFVYVAVGGLISGLIFGFACTLALRITYKGHLWQIEVAVMAMFALGCFLFCEVFKMSGIVGILFAGIVMRKYTTLNLNFRSLEASEYIFETISLTTETLVFIYLGINTVFHVTNGSISIWEPAMICFTIFYCILFRFVIVLSLTGIVNRFRREKVLIRDQFIMSYGGLRGAIAFALAYILEEEIEARDAIITTTLCVIWFTIFVMGSTIKLLIKCLRITGATETENTIATKTFSYPLKDIQYCVNLIIGGQKEEIQWRIWHLIDKFLIYVFVREAHPEEQELFDAVKNVHKIQSGKADGILEDEQDRLRGFNNVHKARMAAFPQMGSRKNSNKEANKEELDKFFSPRSKRDQNFFGSNIKQRNVSPRGNVIDY